MATTAPLRPAALDRLRVEHPDVRLVDVRAPGERPVRHLLPGVAGAAITDRRATGMALSRLPYNTRQRGTHDLPAVVPPNTDPSEVRP